MNIYNIKIHPLSVYYKCIKNIPPHSLCYSKSLGCYYVRYRNENSFLPVTHMEPDIMDERPSVMLLLETDGIDEKGAEIPFPRTYYTDNNAVLKSHGNGEYTLFNLILDRTYRDICDENRFIVDSKLTEAINSTFNKMCEELIQ